MSRALPPTAVADRIVAAPDQFGGAPFVEGSVLRADALLTYLLSMRPEEIEAEFNLQEGDVAAVVTHAAELVRRQVETPPPVHPARLYALDAGRIWGSPRTDDERKVVARLKVVWPGLADVLDRLAHYAR